MSGESTSIEKGVQPVVSITKDVIGRNDVIATITSAGGKEIEITGDVDQAMNLATDLGDMTFDPVADKKLLHKIDWILLPMIGCIYMVQYNDKISNSNASILGLLEYYHMEGNMYSWVGSSFYIGYLFFIFPANVLLQRFPVAKTAGCFITIWGAVLCLHACAGNYAGLITCRTVLGILESSVTPAMVIITGQWWRKEEQFLRTTIWFVCNGLGSILGSGEGYALAKYQNSYSIPAWKLIFVINGLMTVVLGIIFIFYIPDRPDKAWFLNEKEKKMVVLRIKQNQQGFGNAHWKWYQAKEAIFDIQTWIFFVVALASDIPNGSLTNFSAILLSGDFGYSDEMSLLMSMPGGAVAFVGCIAMAYIKTSRLAVSFWSTVITLAFSCVLAFAKDKNARMAGFNLINIGTINMICSLSLFESNTAGHTKKITMNGIYLVGYCIGNLVGPQTFRANEAPTYQSGKITIVVCYAIVMVAVVANYIVYRSRNKQRDKKVAEDGEESLPKIENIEFADLTDKENPYFRYQL